MHMEFSTDIYIPLVIGKEREILYSESRKGFPPQMTFENVCYLMKLGPRALRDIFFNQRDWT